MNLDKKKLIIIISASVLALLIIAGIIVGIVLLSGNDDGTSGGDNLVGEENQPDDENGSGNGPDSDGGNGETDSDGGNDGSDDGEGETPEEPENAPPASESLAFELASDGKSYYVKGIGSCTDSYIVVPSEYNGLPVSGIMYYAFSGNESITGVYLPKSIIEIGMYAFSECRKLTAVVIPSSTKLIGQNAFDGCSLLADVTFPDVSLEMQHSVFKNCRSLKYNEYDNALYLGSEKNPYSILIQAKDKTITSCTVHNDTKTVYNSAFSECESLKSVVIGDSVTHIGNYAFESCKSLESVDMGDSLKYISRYLFFGCRSLKNISIPDSVESVSFQAFSGCNSLKYNEYGNAFYLGNENNPYLLLMKAKDQSITSCKIHEDTKIIFSSAFRGCTSLTDLSVPDSIINVLSLSLFECPSLEYNEYDNGLYLGNENNPYVILVKAKDQSITSCKIHESTRIIYNSAFGSCKLLTSIEIPDSVVYIGTSAFSGCKSLGSVSLTPSVRIIKEQAFSECSVLTRFDFDGTLKQWRNISFEADTDDGRSGWNNLIGDYYVYCTDGKTK